MRKADHFRPSMSWHYFTKHKYMSNSMTTALILSKDDWVFTSVVFKRAHGDMMLSAALTSLGEYESNLCSDFLWCHGTDNAHALWWIKCWCVFPIHRMRPVPAPSDSRWTYLTDSLCTVTRRRRSVNTAVHCSMDCWDKACSAQVFHLIWLPFWFIWLVAGSPRQLMQKALLLKCYLHGLAPEVNTWACQEDIPRNTITWKEFFFGLRGNSRDCFRINDLGVGEFVTFLNDGQSWRVLKFCVCLLFFFPQELSFFSQAFLTCCQVSYKGGYDGDFLMTRALFLIKLLHPWGEFANFARCILRSHLYAPGSNLGTSQWHVYN